MRDCPFCDLANEAILAECRECVAFETGDPVLVESAMIVPRAHRVSPFDLSPAEWAATHDLLIRVREILDQRHSPDGYTVGWNVGAVGGQTVEHVHLHVIPRFADEPLAGAGIRHALKQPSNRRRGGAAPGGGGGNPPGGV